MPGCRGPRRHKRRRRRREEHAHRGEQCPALAFVADHPAEGVGQRGADHKDQQHLDQVGAASRVLERMRRIDVEEAAAVPAQQLDRDLRGDRAASEQLLVAPSSVAAPIVPPKVCGTPCQTKNRVATTQIGSST